MLLQYSYVSIVTSTNTRSVVLKFQQLEDPSLFFKYTSAQCNKKICIIKRVFIDTRLACLSQSPLKVRTLLPSSILCATLNHNEFNLEIPILILYIFVGLCPFPPHPWHTPHARELLFKGMLPATIIPSFCPQNDIVRPLSAQVNCLTVHDQ